MKNLKILIADDEEFLQEVYEMILGSEFHCTSVKVKNGNEAIEALKEDDSFDLIISDYNMPVANGGKIYLFNKEHANIPFYLFSGGEINDYREFSDFNLSNKYNHFFNKPFTESELLNAVKGLPDKNQQAKVLDVHHDSTRFIKVKLEHYLQYTTTAAEVYIRLSEDKFTKIIDVNPENLPDFDLLKHYQQKGIETVYIDRAFFSSLLQDVFNHFHKKLVGEKKAETLFEISGLHFNVSIEGLNDIGISSQQIEKTNEMIEDTVKSLLSNPSSQKRFRELCSKEGFAVGHSLLIMYLAGCLCHEAGLNFSSTMKKICVAAFYHDLSLFETDALDDLKSLEEATDREALFNHPRLSAELLPPNIEVIEDTKRIILEHHEKPGGDGYPKKLFARQISPLGCLFILSQEITFCLLRNNFSQERLKDFLTNSKEAFTQGNFSKFYKASEVIFALDT